MPLGVDFEVSRAHIGQVSLFLPGQDAELVEYHSCPDDRGLTSGTVSKPTVKCFLL